MLDVFLAREKTLRSEKQKADSKVEELKKRREKATNISSFDVTEGDPAEIGSFTVAEPRPLPEPPTTLPIKRQPEAPVRELTETRGTPESAANIWGHRSGANFEGFAENYLEVEAKKVLTARNTGGRSTFVKNLSVVNDVIPELVDEAKANGELAGASKMEITLWAREKAQELVDRLASEYKVVALKK